MTQILKWYDSTEKECHHFCPTGPSKIIAILWHLAQIQHSKLIDSLNEWVDPVTSILVNYSKEDSEGYEF